MESAKFPQWSQVGTAGAMQVPVVGLQPLRSVEQPGPVVTKIAPSMWMVNSSRRSLSRCQVRSLDGVCRLSSACLLRLAKAKVCPGCPGCPVAPFSPSIPSCSWKVWEFGSAVGPAISCLESFRSWRRQMAAFDFAVFRIKVRCTVCEIVFFSKECHLVYYSYCTFTCLISECLSSNEIQTTSLGHLPPKNLGLSQNWFQWIWNDSQLASNICQIILNIVSNSVN